MVSLCLSWIGLQLGDAKARSTEASKQVPVQEVPEVLLSWGRDKQTDWESLVHLHREAQRGHLPSQVDAPVTQDQVGHLSNWIGNGAS